ncbi:MAG: tRNA pseudouridine(55) synthase TruB [Defluviitaleaceae bacterium]|nr:tRNA pseudouridine(55) synthase TruB [Defluviitaleaceae bacterium]
MINVYKEKGYTSHDVVAVLRRILRTKKVGHTGTLDPQAEGVLPVCVGRATKLADFVMSENKTYVAEVILGMTTDTDDNWGKVQTSSPVTATDTEILAAVQSFVGGYMQVPPMYSAIKVNGERLYKLARKGETGENIKRPPRKVEIFNIKIVEFDKNANGVFTIEVECGKGTYIRSLCADIGKKLGCGACMGNLTRTKTGGFTLETAFRLSQIEKMAQAAEYSKFLTPITKAFSATQIICENPPKSLLNGAAIEFAALAPQKTDSPALSQLQQFQQSPLYPFCWICTKKDEPIGLYKIKNGFLYPEVMIYASNS